MNIADGSSAFPRHRPTTRRSAPCTQMHPQHHWQWLDPILRLKELVSGMTLMSADSIRKRATAAPARVPFSASMDVAPSIASINTPRQLTITAYFPLGCGPTDASVSSVTIEGVRSLEVRFDRPSPDFAFCDLVLVPYAISLTYVPTEAGDLPVRMMTSDDVAVGESVVVTRCARDNDAHFDVTGRWIDPAARETGLAFMPDSPRNNNVVGTWNFHDHQGLCHRYSIQGIRWREQDVEAEGAIFEMSPCGASAPSRDLVMPLPAGANQLGNARITFYGLNSARIFALGFGGNVLFTSNLERTTI